MTNTALHVAIPSMNEAEWLPITLRQLLAHGTKTMHIWVCVNQPDSWWDRDDKRTVCENNRKTLAYLSTVSHQLLHVIDRSSPGKGWKGKHYGVGQARRTLMETIIRHASPEDIILSLDADTLFDPGYPQSIMDCFQRYPHAVALSNPYEHRLTGNDTLDRAMLRYEIYMRYYAVNMWRTGSPYTFTALGSAIGVPVKAYRSVGGLTPKKSGEDFYFLQKLRKSGWICNYNPKRVYPATRYSDRVFFGTGPALIKGSRGDWESYPVYSHMLFDRVKATIDMFPALYTKKRETPMCPFFHSQFGESDIFAPLRQNAATREKFIRAAHQKVDGLRILQFLKNRSKADTTCDEQNLMGYFASFHPSVIDALIASDFEPDTLSFSSAPLQLMDTLRYALMAIETRYQQNDVS